MRFPVKPMKGKHSFPHHQTLLDGELIVDEDRDTGKHLYRYLAYDIMAINNKSVAHHPWKVRTLCEIQSTFPCVLTDYA